jgi:hypothetical protein
MFKHIKWSLHGAYKNNATLNLEEKHIAHKFKQKWKFKIQDSKAFT